MNSREIRRGALLSYLLIIINTFYGLFFTPFLISALGDGEYGVYKIMGSLIGSVTILDFGIGSTVLRYAAKFHADRNQDGLDNFAAMSVMEAGGLSLIMTIVCIGVYFSIDKLYSASLSVRELGKAKELFILFTVILVINTFEKVLFSLIAACEHFAFANMLKLLRVVSKLVLAYLILQQVADSAMLLKIDILLLVCNMGLQMLYLRREIGISIRLKKWDNRLFWGTFRYTILLFIHSIAVQFNGNLDNMVIGAVIGASAVTIYSIGLQLYNMYEQFALAFSDLMLPTVSKQIAQGASTRELEDTVITIGRLEFMALGGALCGFAIIGKEFIGLWLGDGYSFAWTVGILLMIPTTIPLVQNVCLSILRAKNKMLFRTVAVCVMAVFNFIFTVVGVPKYGAIAAAVGTVIGLVGANIIAMNIYYVKVIGLNIGRIFANVFSRTWICCIIAGVALYIADRMIGGTWALWGIKVIIFLAVYAGALLLWGMRKNEREYFLKVVKLKGGINSN